MCQSKSPSPSSQVSSGSESSLDPRSFSQEHVLSSSLRWPRHQVREVPWGRVRHLLLLKPVSFMITCRSSQLQMLSLTCSCCSNQRVTVIYHETLYRSGHDAAAGTGPCSASTKVPKHQVGELGDASAVCCSRFQAFHRD